MAMPFNKWEGILGGYESLVATRISDGWPPYFLNFMFRQLPESKSAKFEIMKDEVMRVYSTLLPHIVRRPNSPFWYRFNPLLIGCPDNQVRKRDRHFVDAPINDGWHFNAIILMPPEPHSRFREHLANHFLTNRKLYCRTSDFLQRIHVMFVETGTMLDYAMKHLKRGNISTNDILLLPKARSEIVDSFQTRKGGELKPVKYRNASNAFRDWSNSEKTYMTAPLLHQGYEIVDHLDKLWRAETANYDPYLAGQPRMSPEEIKALIRALKNMRKECRLGIEKLRKISR